MSSPRPVAPFLSAVVVAVSCASSAFALNPALDVGQYGHMSWKIRDGFFKSRITVMAQTPDGYLWLGTEIGLLRFDGVRTVPLRLPTGQSLPHDWIRSLHVGRDGTLWIGTLGGLASWKDGTLRRYPEVRGGVDALIEDRGGTVWAGTNLGVSSGGRLCAIRTGAVQCFGEDGAFGQAVSSLYEDSAGALWVTATNGLWRWTPAPSISFSLPEAIADGLQPLTRSDDGTPLIATRTGIVQFVNGRLESFPLPPGVLPLRSPKVFRDRDGGLWVGTHSGLLHLHPGRADRFGRVDGLSGDFVNKFFEDREGNVWVITDDGLDRFRELAATTLSVSQGLSSESAASVLAARDGNVWLNSGGTLNRWKDGHIAVFRARGASEVQSLLEDSRGRLWAATRAGLGYVDGDRFTSINGVPGGFVTSIAEDARATLWIANRNDGLVRVSADGEVRKIPWTELGHKDSASRMVADVRGGLWLGFYDGGLVYYADGRVAESYPVPEGAAASRIGDLRLAPDGALWISSERGLSRLKNGRIATLSKEHGLPCGRVAWMVNDAIDSVWLRTDCGLVRIARAELDAWAAAADKGQPSVAIHPTLFDSSDGIRSGSYLSSYSPVVTTSADGKLWFADQDGVSIVDPRHLPFNRLPPPVHIEQITADRDVHRMTSTANQRLHLPPLVRDLEIDYTALSLVAPEKVQFRYKLEGWDRDWQDVGNRRQAFYGNLPPRSYRFRVIAANNSGVWNEAGAALDLSVDPAFYQTTWFPALIAGMVIGVAWAAHRIRVGIVQTHEREISALNERLMKAQEQERIRIAGELHDGVMQQMLAVTMMLGTAKRRTSESETKTSLDKIQDKLIQAGTEIRQLSHDLHPPILQEAGLPDALRSHCEQFSASGGIPVACDADDAARDLSRGAALALFRIAQEALANAAKHAHAKRITVRLTRSADVMSLSVADDGAGFDPGSLGKRGGLGLVMMRERASQLNGTFEFESAPGHGTTITVVIPFR